MHPIFAPLEKKPVPELTELGLRVLFFDPSELYARVKVKPYKRIQNHMQMGKLFPNLNTHRCACGCDGLLVGRRTRWATEDCSKFAVRVWMVIDGRAEIIKPYIGAYHGWCCHNCGDADSVLQLDHIVPVHKGGGGCWFNNYQLLCIECHKKKTKIDVGTFDARNQIKLL